MKQLMWLAVVLLVAGRAQADEPLSSVFSGERNVYLHVILEKAHGVDIRGRTMSQELIAKVEAEGRQVRPTRDSQYVESYRAFQSDGTFKTFPSNIVTARVLLRQQRSRTPNSEIFAHLPPLANWKRGSDLAVGGTNFSVRGITANDPGDAGKKGEIELRWLEQGKPVYFYYCLPIMK